MSQEYLCTSCQQKCRHKALVWSLISVFWQVVTDFFDELKSRSRGYASMEYKITGYKKSDLVRLDIKINAEVGTMHILVEPCAATLRLD